MQIDVDELVAIQTDLEGLGDCLKHIAQSLAHTGGTGAAVFYLSAGALDLAERLARQLNDPRQTVLPFGVPGGRP